MQKHISIYLKHFDIAHDEVWMCEACTKQFRINNGLQIHHIYGRGKGKNVISNLMSLCVKCHSRAHGGQNYVSKSEFQYIHNSFMSGNHKQYLK